MHRVEVVGQLVDEDPVPREQGRLHRLRRDIKSLYGKGLYEQGGDQRHDHDDDPFDQHVPAAAGLGRLTLA